MNSSAQKLQMYLHVSSCIQSAEKYETKWVVFSDLRKRQSIFMSYESTENFLTRRVSSFKNRPWSRSTEYMVPVLLAVQEGICFTEIQFV